MKELDELLEFIIDNVDGALSTAIGGMDGLLIEQYPKQGNDLSAFAAEMTNVLGMLSRLSVNEVEGGNLQEIMATAEKVMSYVRLLNEEIFLVILMNPSGNLGKARLYSDQVSEQILEFFQ